MIPGAPLMTLPASAVRAANQKRETAAADSARFDALTTLKPEEIDTLWKLWPMCALCKRPVQFLSWTASPGTTDMVYKVRCHGAAETTTVPRSLALQGDIAGGVAFATHRGLAEADDD